MNYLHRHSIPRRLQNKFLKAMEYIAIVLHNDFKLNSPSDGVHCTANLRLYLFGQDKAIKNRHALHSYFVRGATRKMFRGKHLFHWTNPLLMTVCKLMLTVILMTVAATFGHSGGKKFHLQYVVGEKSCQPFSVGMILSS